MDAKNETCRFDNELSSGERAHCMEELQRALGPEGLDECVCASCDRLVLLCVPHRVNDTDLDYLKMMTKALHMDTSKLPETLVKQYRSPNHLATLHGAMISPRGIQTYANEDKSLRSWLLVCNECDNDIQHGRLPKFAIANGFFIGRLPEQLRDLTLPERFMTQLTNVVALTRVMRGGHHRCIRSHCIAFDCTPGPPISLLPRSLAGVSSYRVVMVGEFTAGQVDQVRKLHRIRNKSVGGVFGFYKSHNHLCADISRDEDVMNSVFTDDRVEQVFVEHIPDPDGKLDDEMNGEQQSVRGESDAWRVVGDENECRVIERRIGLADDGTPAVECANLTAANGNESGEREFEIRRSNHIANDISGNLLARMFLHLFPFGRGGPEEPRRIRVSVQECTKYYSMLSGRQFAEDELFLLVAFDRISLSNMYIQNHIRCQRFPHLLEGYENLSAEQLGQVLLENERRRHGRLPWKSSEDTVAQRFLTTVEIGTRSVWGSNAERAQCRHKAFAYQARFGQPALFVTLTSNTDNSLVLAQYTGISSLHTLFDILEARLPSKTELREASRGNDCASARLFIRQVDAFIRYALGMDPATHKRLPFRGLFGDVKAFFGMVETQGRGTLHIHFPIWLDNCPQNSIATEKLLNSSLGKDFCQLVTSNADSVVRNDLPIPLDGCGCSKCGATFDNLVALPIPDQARKKLQSSHVRFRLHVVEPMLAECRCCGAQFSSQHVIRNALLKTRPRFWPPLERHLSAHEIEDQARLEIKCRNSKRHAADKVCDRESVHASFCSETSNHDGTSELREQANHRQMALCKADDDPFRSRRLSLNRVHSLARHRSLLVLDSSHLSSPLRNRLSSLGLLLN